jgi:hypothetical protein
VAVVPAVAVPVAVPPHTQRAPYAYPPLDYNVELVSDPDDEDDEERSLVDLDRRDWMMLGAGGLLMLAAIGTGFGLTRLTRSKLDEKE